MWPQQTDHAFGQLRQIVIEFLAHAAHQEGKTFKQTLDKGVASARFVEIEHCRLLRMSTGKLFTRFQQVAHFSVVITQG